jgi:AmmeMemoRadiSam system protein B
MGTARTDEEASVMSLSSVRSPAVAGLFYPAEPARMEAALDRLLDDRPAAGRCLRAVVVPHAAWSYSGRVAGAVYRCWAVPRLVVILGPSHSGAGPPGSVMARGRWAVPGGEVPIADGLAGEILGACPELAEDSLAHREEHAIEVQLPFLRRLRPDVAFVPIALGRADLGFCAAVGRRLAGVIARSPEPIGMICSTDLNHYESQAISRVKDRAATDAILAGDPERLLRTVREQRVSMCGLGPALATLFALDGSAHGQPELVRYETSGDVSGDFERVVGYAGVIIPESSSASPPPSENVHPPRAD